MSEYKKFCKCLLSGDDIEYCCFESCRCKGVSPAVLMYRCYECYFTTKDINEIKEHCSKCGEGETVNEMPGGMK